MNQMKKIAIITCFALLLFNAGQVYSQVDSVKTSTQTTTTTTVNTSTTDAAAKPAGEQQESPDTDSDDFSRVVLGLRFMPTFTKFDVKTVDEGVAKTSFVVGYGVGGFVGYNFSKNVGVQLEAIYSVLSQKYTERNLERQIDLSYLHFPLLLSLNTDITKPVNLNVSFGPQIGINTGSEVSSDGGPDGVDTVTAVIAVKPADIGFAYGAGVDFKLGPAVSLSLGFRGVYGLVDISENSKSTTTNQYYVLDRSHVKTYAGYAGLIFNL
jgi:hypothetical protein